MTLALAGELPVAAKDFKDRRLLEGSNLGAPK
jgi:hypothetical protein